MGTVSSRTYNVKNTSRIALEYEWKLHHPDGDVLSVERPCGVIQPNETQVCGKKKYKTKSVA